MAVTRILLAPGASGSIERLRRHADGLERRGLSVGLVPLPKGTAERALPVYAVALERKIVPSVIGGHSFGGRVASLLAAGRGADGPAALVLLSYPLHAPGRHDAWDQRTSHWPAITCPVLLLSGDRDPFARHDLLRRAAERLRHAELHLYPGLRHGLDPVLDDALDRIAAFVHANT